MSHELQHALPYVGIIFANATFAALLWLAIMVPLDRWLQKRKARP